MNPTPAPVLSSSKIILKEAAVGSCGKNNRKNENGHGQTLDCPAEKDRRAAKKASAGTVTMHMKRVNSWAKGLIFPDPVAEISFEVFYENTERRSCNERH